MSARIFDNLDSAIKENLIKEGVGKKTTQMKAGGRENRKAYDRKIYWLVTGFLSVFGAFFLVDIIPAFALPWVILALFIVVVLKFSHTALLRLGKAV